MRTDVTAIVAPAEREESAEVAPASGARGKTRWVIIALLVAGWVAGVLWRLWLGHPIVTPIGHADEDSYLNAARAIGGGPPGFSSETPLFHRVGYPMFISPAFSLGLSFADAYRLVHLLNAVANAAVILPAYFVARRMLRLGRWPALVGAFVAATLPATVFWSLVAMTDSIIGVAFLSWVLAVHWWLTAPQRKLAAVTAGLMTGVLYMIHVRGTVIALVFVALALWAVIRRQSRWGTAILALVPVVALVVVNQLVIHFLHDKLRLYGNIAGANTLDVLTDPHRLVVLAGAFGTNMWYLCVVSAGLAGIGWAYTAVQLWRPTEDLAYRWTSMVTLLSTIGVSAAAALVLAGLVNANVDAIYTRYVQMFVPFWLLAGIAVLFRRDLRAVLKLAVVPVLVLAGGGALIAFRLWYVQDHGRHLAYGAFGGPDIITISGGFTQFRPVTASVIGVGGLAVLIAATRARRLAVPVLTALLVANLVTMGVMRSHIIKPLGTLNAVQVHIQDLGVTSADKVGMTWGMTAQMYFGLYHEVEWADTIPADKPKPGVTVMMARSWPGLAKDWDGTKYGFHKIGESPNQHYAVWRRD